MTAHAFAAERDDARKGVTAEVMKAMADEDEDAEIRVGGNLNAVDGGWWGVKDEVVKNVWILDGDVCQHMIRVCEKIFWLKFKRWLN